MQGGARGCEGVRGGVTGVQPLKDELLLPRVVGAHGAPHLAVRSASDAPVQAVPPVGGDALELLLERARQRVLRRRGAVEASRAEGGRGQRRRERALRQRFGRAEDLKECEAVGRLAGVGCVGEREHVEPGRRAAIAEHGHLVRRVDRGGRQRE